MHFNKSFTSYRRSESAGIRSYSGTPTVTDGSCLVEPASGELRATPGLEAAVKYWQMATPESDILKSDKVVIDSVDYYVVELEKQDLMGVSQIRCILTEDL